MDQERINKYLRECEEKEDLAISQGDAGVVHNLTTFINSLYFSMCRQHCFSHAIAMKKGLRGENE